MLLSLLTARSMKKMKRITFYCPSAVFVFSVLVQISSCFIPDEFIVVRSASSFCTTTARRCSKPSVANDLSTKARSDIFESTPSSLSTTCTYCSKSFASRNALFRHLHEDNQCSVQHGGGSSIRATKVKESVAFLFGYEDFDIIPDDKVRRQMYSQQPTVAEAASQRIQQSLVQTLMFHLEDESPSSFPLSEAVTIVSSTQSSVAKSRHSALSQEVGCSATGDVLVVTLTLPWSMSIESWKQVFRKLQLHLSTSQTDNQIPVQLFACRLMDKDNVPFHAERSCTQRIYHYVLPLSWLPDSDVLTEWWHLSDREPPHSQTTDNNKYSKYPQKVSKPPTDTLKLLKEALRCAESAHIPFQRDNNIVASNDDVTKIAKGRYGALAHRERRPWHSFVSPSLIGGAASPNHETVWRVVDRARIIGFVEEERKENDNPQQRTCNPHINAIVEIKGDDFLPQQVRRIVGSAVAIVNGWLPKDYFSMSTSSDTVVETPLAPEGRLYLSGLRFHFDELEADGLQLFESHQSRRVVEEWNATRAWETNNVLQRRLLQRKGRENEVSRELNWLKALRDTTCPRICESLKRQQNDDVGDLPMESIAPYQVVQSYQPVLTELRRIISDGEWPETSIARSSIIRDIEVVEGRQRSGSFTVVNPQVFSSPDAALPLANERFHHLVEEVFNLERVLSQNQMKRFTVNGVHDEDVKTDRSPSSHCAVNCNAEFTPHVDSGVGAGQMISMIVGLGDYRGGELFVEGNKIDIKYNPVEFDGFRLRHWTAKFMGERFSLVWFTPDSKG